MTIKLNPQVLLVPRLYETYNDNYSYFKSICLQQEDFNDKPVIQGVQGLKNLVTSTLRTAPIEQ